MSFARFRRAKLFLLVVTFYSVSVQLVNYSIFHPILPFYLRKIWESSSVCVYNVSEVDPCLDEDTNLEAQVSRTIGIVTGTGSAMQLLTSIFSGILLQKLSLHTNLIISVCLNLASPGLAFFANNVVTMCFANAAISAGSLLTFVTYYSMLSERSENDKERMRLVTLYNVFNGLGNVIGYSAASASYQFLGHRITFAILFSLLAVDLVLRSLLKCPDDMQSMEIDSVEKIEKTGAPDEMTRSQLLQELGTAPTIDDEEKDEAWHEWVKYLVDPYVVLVNVITFFLLISICTLCTTGPYFVSTYLKAEQWQTGLNMGVGSCVELIMLSTSAVVVTTHRRRWLTILLCCLLSSAGFVWYPFASSVWEVIVPETFIRVSKAVGIVFVGTLYPYITDCRGVGDCKMGYAIHGVFLSVGATLGSFGAGLIVVYATFQWLYVAVGTAMLMMALTVLPFIKLKPKEEEVHDFRQSRVSLASLGQSRLSLNRSRLDMNSVYRSRSRNLGHTLATSMTDMTISRLSIGRSMIL